MLCCLTLSHPQKDALDYAKTVEGIRDGRSAEEWRPSLIASTRWGGEPIALISTDWHASFRPDVANFMRAGLLLTWAQPAETIVTAAITMMATTTAVTVQSTLLLCMDPPRIFECSEQCCNLQ